MSRRGSDITSSPTFLRQVMAVKTKRQGFFEVSLSGLKAASQVLPQSSIPAVYISLCSGVDNSKQSLVRTCTHAQRAVQRRLAKRLFLRSEIALAVEQLVRQGEAVDLTPAGGKRKTGAATYQISPNRTNDLVPVSHGFIGIKVSVEGGRRRYELHSGPANLSGLLHACSSLGRLVDREQAQTDALQVYFHLLHNQDFKRFGGVDPSAVCGVFRDCRPGENPVYDSSYMPVAGEGRTAQVRFAVAPGELLSSSQFAKQVLTGVATHKGASMDLEVRVTHAINQLVKAQLLYRAAVLWDDDPRTTSAKPLATIAVRGSWLAENAGQAEDRDQEFYEYSAQKAIDKLLHHWCTLRKQDRFDSSSESVFKDSGIYRYVVPTAERSRWVLLDQYRVRWWAATEDNLTALGYDERRSQDYLKVITDVVTPEVEDF